MQQLAVLALPIAIAACGDGTPTAPTASVAEESVLTIEPWRAQAAASIDSNDALESAVLLADKRFGDRLVASKRNGLLLFAADGSLQSRLPGAFGAIDYRSGDERLLVAAVDLDRQQAVVTAFDGSGQWQPPVALARGDYKVDGLCLHRDNGGNDYLFLIGEEGIGEQWLVAQRGQPLAEPLRVRALSLPPASEYCRVDDATAQLFVNEENVGLWAYAAGAEADLLREPVALRQPFGDIARSATGMALVPGGVLLLDAEAGALHRYRRDTDGWVAEPTLALNGLNEPEGISARGGDSLQLLLRDDNGLHQAELNWSLPSPPTAAVIPQLSARVQTEPVPSLGDAADDPAIWLHPEQPTQSRVVVTDKQGGVLVHDLEGRTLQDLRVGRINNIDVRAGFQLGNERVDLAVGSNRDHNSLHLFAIDRSSGELRDIGEVETPLKEIYGICLFKDADGAIFAIANDKDGSFLQYRLDGSQGSARAALVRRFAVDSQPEGCVADDAEQRLFIGEEDVAVWALDARADASVEMTQVVAAGSGVEADIEGLAIYRADSAAYLVVSSQGDDSYVLFDATPPFARRGAFRIGADAAAGIDGVSETDGLDVTAANLGGPWSRGLLVVQDGRKRMPEGNQNYKYVAWSDIAALLDLP